MSNRDFIIILAWPEGMVDAAGAWYDKIAAIDGKYRVGHSALCLVNSLDNKIHYFDFGRYHTPIGFGRIRDGETDPDVKIKESAIIKNNKITNIDKILIEISNNKSYHAKGNLYASIMRQTNFSKAFNFAKNWQTKGAMPYGPFVTNGTNCSRFVAKICIKSQPSTIKRLRFQFPFTISPSPKRNVSIGNNNYYIVNKNKCITVNRQALKAYFSSIEKSL